MVHNVHVFLYIQKCPANSGTPLGTTFFRSIKYSAQYSKWKVQEFAENSAIPLFYVYDCRSLDIRASHNNYVNRVHQQAFKCPALYCVSVYEILRLWDISLAHSVECWILDLKAPVSIPAWGDLFISTFPLFPITHVYIIWVFCLCMRQMYISFGCFLYVSVHEIHVFIFLVF